MQNGNSFDHAFMPAHPRKEHDGRKVSPNDVGNSLDVEYGKKDRTNLVKVYFLFTSVI